MCFLKLLLFFELLNNYFFFKTFNSNEREIYKQIINDY